jgi:hypothetical protein
LTREEVAVAVAQRGGLDGVDVGAGALLGDRVALPPLAADGGHHPALELLVGGHLRQPGGGRVDHPTEGVGGAADLLLHQHLLERREAAATELLGHVDGVELSSWTRRRWRFSSSADSSPSCSSASTSWGISSSTNALAAAWISRSASDIGELDSGTAGPPGCTGH